MYVYTKLLYENENANPRKTKFVEYYVPLFGIYIHFYNFNFALLSAEPISILISGLKISCEVVMDSV